MFNDQTALNISGRLARAATATYPPTLPSGPWREEEPNPIQGRSPTRRSAWPGEGGERGSHREVEVFPFFRWSWIGMGRIRSERQHHASQQRREYPVRPPEPDLWWIPPGRGSARIHQVVPLEECPGLFEPIRDEAEPLEGKAPSLLPVAVPAEPLCHIPVGVGPSGREVLLGAVGPSGHTGGEAVLVLEPG